MRVYQCLTAKHLSWTYCYIMKKGHSVVVFFFTTMPLYFDYSETNLFPSKIRQKYEDL
ncbi:hypothetical protein HMPREF1870_01773 [Bacteroidales bacterium KA00344]|nr:hypothetical protein HMPREF1870_01773 [Bacteroidales bacterium KA00344]